MELIMTITNSYFIYIVFFFEKKKCDLVFNIACNLNFNLVDGFLNG